MKVKIKTTILFYCLNALLSYTYGQTLKTYSGKFEEGIATYQYFENDQFDRILNGTFSYKGKLVDMNGSYKNDKKNGKWEITAINRKIDGRSGGAVKLNTKISGNFLNGNFDGNWSYYNSLGWPDSKGDEDTEVSKATFYKNHFVGKYSYLANWPKRISIQGQFDSLGFMNNVWYYKQGEIKDEIRFMKGIAYWRLQYDTTNGEKKIFCDSTIFVKQFLELFDTLLGGSNINGNFYFPDTILISNKTGVNFLGGINYTEKDEEFNPISVWDESIFNVYESGYLANPLYYFPKGNFHPKGFQIFINQFKLEEEKFKLKVMGLDELNTYINTLGEQEKDILSHDMEDNFYKSEIFKIGLQKKLAEESKKQKVEERLNKEANRKRQEEERQIQLAMNRQQEANKIEDERKAREFEDSDFGRLKKAVTIEFKTWMIKSEYETNIDYEKRIKSMADTKLKTVTSEQIELSKKRSSQSINVKLGNYDAISESFSLVINNNQSTPLSIPKQIAPFFPTTFNFNEGYHNYSAIFILPKKFVMENNNWKIIEGVILFDNLYQKAINNFTTYSKDFKLFKEENKYYYNLTKYDEKMEIENINTIKENPIKKGIYFYEMKLNSLQSQQLNFNFSDLGITLPEF
jgi:hypothetical protein